MTTKQITHLNPALEFPRSLLSEHYERQPYLSTGSSDGFHVMHINTLSGARDRLERMIDGSGLVKSHLLSQQMGKRVGNNLWNC